MPNIKKIVDSSWNTLMINPDMTKNIYIYIPLQVMGIFCIEENKELQKEKIPLQGNGSMMKRKKNELQKENL